MELNDADFTPHPKRSARFLEAVIYNKVGIIHECSIEQILT